MEIRTDKYSVRSEGREIIFSGVMRLSGSEAYAPIFDLMMSVLESESRTVTLDLSDLEFLNSSGINLLGKFTIEARKRAHVQLVVRAGPDIPWQSKSLRNLQRLHPRLTLMS